MEKEKIASKWTGDEENSSYRQTFWNVYDVCILRVEVLLSCIFTNKLLFFPSSLIMAQNHSRSQATKRKQTIFADNGLKKKCIQRLLYRLPFKCLHDITDYIKPDFAFLSKMFKCLKVGKTLFDRNCLYVSSSLIVAVHLLFSILFFYLVFSSACVLMC